MNEEDAAAWREERKRNWPTREKGEAHREKLAQKRRRIAKVEARKREEYELEAAFRNEARAEARLARATVERERTDNMAAADCAAENKPKRAGRLRRNMNRAPCPRWSDESEDENTCDGIPRFRGTAGFGVPEVIAEDEQDWEESTADGFVISDEEILDDEEKSSSAPAPEQALKIVVVDGDTDSEPPEEIKQESGVPTEPASAPQKMMPSSSSSRPKKPRRANHPQVAAQLGVENLSPQMLLRRRIFRQRMRQTFRQEGPAPSTLLERLLEKDIATERTALLQCVKYVCENNFFGIRDGERVEDDGDETDD